MTEKEVFKSKYEKKSTFVMVMIVYLTGIFMGALDMGIVTPARVIIQNDLGVDATAGVWVLTIYTLAYAVAIPIMGKLADIFGRKLIYLISIGLFALGSIVCGLSQVAASFPLILLGRVIQAIGGGGIIPLATAEFGTAFPPEKRGMALGLVGSVFGIANIFGASAGSAILDVFGLDNWPFIFYVNIPISIFIIIAGLLVLENNREENRKPVDFAGIIVMSLMILSLLYGLKNINYFKLGESLVRTDVYPFLIFFLLMIPTFIWVERRAQDPLVNLAYFTNRNLIITMVLSFLAGFVMAAVIFVPQFAENTLKIKAGSGGYLVIIIGLFSGIGAPLSGKLIDKYGVKLVLGGGFLATIISGFYLIFVTTASPSFLTVAIGLMFTGLGMGFVVGTPLNYMMMADTDESESNSALAVLSLIRSVGMAVAPAIMVGFLAAAGANIQTAVLSELPDEVTIPKLAYADEIDASFNEMMASPFFQAEMGNMEIPSMQGMDKIKLDFAAMMSADAGEASLMPAIDAGLVDEVIDLMMVSDVTSITEDSKAISGIFFDFMSDPIISQVQSGMSEAMSGLSSAGGQMQAVLASGQLPPVPGIQDEIKGAISDLENLEDMMLASSNSLPQALERAKADYLTEIDSRAEQIETSFQQTLNSGFKNVFWVSILVSFLAIVLLGLYQNRSIV